MRDDELDLRRAPRDRRRARRSRGPRRRPAARGTPAAATRPTSAVAAGGWLPMLLRAAARTYRRAVSTAVRAIPSQTAAQSTCDTGSMVSAEISSYGRRHAAGRPGCRRRAGSRSCSCRGGRACPRCRCARARGRRGRRRPAPGRRARCRRRGARSPAPGRPRSPYEMTGAFLASRMRSPSRLDEAGAGSDVAADPDLGRRGGEQQLLARDAAGRGRRARAIRRGAG